MFWGKCFSLSLLTFLCLPELSLAITLKPTDLTADSTESIENIEDEAESLDTQPEQRLARRRIRVRPRVRGAVRRSIRRSRRRALRRGVRRNFRRSWRSGRAIRRTVRGLTGIGIGAAIADVIDDDRDRTEAIIIEAEKELRDRDYYNALYEDQSLDQGGYYGDDFGGDFGDDF